MSNQFMYPGDQAIIIQDGTIIWNDQAQDQSSLSYFDANSTIINDSTNNESYVTAIGDNETQYLSILEQSDSNEITLEDLHNLTIENKDTVLPNNVSPDTTTDVIPENNEENDAGEVIVFTMDGSDDLYGLQMSCDETGNVQKYQFKFRTTPDGQLEPIPETVTLLPSNVESVDEEAIDNLATDDIVTEESEPQDNQQYFLVQTPLDSDNCSEEIAQNDAELDELNMRHVYIKGECSSPDVLVEEHDIENVDPEIFEHCIPQDTNLETHLESLNIKTEGYAGIENAEIALPQEENETILEESGTSSECHDEQLLADVDSEHSHEQLVQHFFSENSQIEVQYETELETQERATEDCQYEDVIYKCEENYSEITDQYLGETDDNGNSGSETEQYQIAENYTGEDEEAEPQETPIITTTSEAIQNLSEPIIQKPNVLKNPLANLESEDKLKKSLLSVKYYVVYHEKENVNSLADNAIRPQLPLTKLTKSNPRSVLRTSFLSQKDKRQKLDTNILPECDLYHKRFAKNKEAMRAKHFHNFLNRTTIPQAPVRQQRQPRKQEIKPVIERSDEEIIVQEVIVSSSGFVENLNKTVGNKVQVTAVVELSDSEDEFNSKVRRSRRKTHHLLRNTAESEINIIEINSDNEESDVLKSDDAETLNDFKKNISRNSPVTLKRRRGRPPKNKREYCAVSLENIEESPSKRSRTDCEPIVIDSDITSVTSATLTDRKEIICPFCPKTFPSQNSLNTHIIHHNLENSLKNKAKMNSTSSLMSRKSLLPKLEYNHKCDECQETFKNIILLKKHNCTKQQTSFNCSVCLKQFRDITLLNIHKKSHAKSNLIKNTSIAKVSPKKILHRPSKGLIKSPKKISKKSFKCTECPKVCDSEDKLAIHLKMHKKLVCSSCFLSFSSKILLDVHVRTNCVKTKAANKRLSFTVRKSFINTPPRRLSISKPNEKLNSTTRQSVLSVKLECDKCTMKFSTFRNLYTHKVQKHGLSTPDKSLMTKPKQGVYKPRAAHGGIPANDRLKKAYAELRKKLAESDLIIT